MGSNSTKTNLICFFGFHKWDTTSDPRCYRCGCFKLPEDPHAPALFTRETRNHASRSIQKRRDLGIMDPSHDD